MQIFRKIGFSLKIGYIGSLKFCCYYLQYIPAPERFDHTWFDPIAGNFEAIFFFGATVPVGQGFLIHEVSRSHSTTHHSRLDSTGRVIRPS